MGHFQALVPCFTHFRKGIFINTGVDMDIVLQLFLNRALVLQFPIITVVVA